MVAVFIFVVFLGVLDIGGPKSRKDSTSYRIQHLFAIFHWESNFFLLRVPHPSLPLRTPSNNNNLWEKVTNLPLECIGFIDVTYSNWTAISTNSRMVITETTISLPVKCGRPVNQRFINLHGVIVFQLEERTFRKYFTLILNILSSRNDYSIWPNCTVIIKRFNILLIIVN